jgi:peptidoglycan/LPS O-acetylase OafA/YrhL
MLGEWGQPGAATDEHDMEPQENDAVDEVDGMRCNAAVNVVVGEVANATESRWQGVGLDDE